LRQFEAQNSLLQHNIRHYVFRFKYSYCIKIAGIAIASWTGSECDRAEGHIRGY